VPTTNPTVWQEIFYGAAGNLIGGFIATLLWWVAMLWWERRKQLTAVRQKRNAIAIEVAKVRAWLRLLKEDPDRASVALPSRASQVLGTLIRLGPDITPGRSLEPALGDVEHRLGMVEIATTRFFAATMGIATAMRGNEAEVDFIRRQLSIEADKALESLSHFEQTVLSD
jgi:hypothetical protein